MGEITQIKNSAGVDQFPITKTKAIYDDEGRRLDESLKSLSDLFLIERVTTETKNANPKAYWQVNFDCRKDGYKPLGVVGIQIKAPHNELNTIFSYSILNPGNSYFFGYNNYTSAEDLYIVADILYIKTN